VKKSLIEGEIGEKRGKFALVSGKEANIREKARLVYCPQDYVLVSITGTIVHCSLKFSCLFGKNFTLR